VNGRTCFKEATGPKNKNDGGLLQRSMIGDQITYDTGKLIKVINAKKAEQNELMAKQGKYSSFKAT